MNRKRLQVRVFERQPLHHRTATLKPRNSVRILEPQLQPNPVARITQRTCKCTYRDVATKRIPTFVRRID
jgi:hypothetical protein